MLLRHWSQELRASFWFLPGAIVVGSIAVAIGIIAIDASIENGFVKDWPLVFGTGADGARGLLSAVASSMITVAGVVFSITIVALSLTSSQYSSRVLRNFMRDRINQTVLGVFVGVFAYCLIVLRTIRGGDEGAFVPSLAVMVGLLLAFVGIAFLIYFIHHIALSIQAASIIAAVSNETLSAVDRLFPDRLGESHELAEEDRDHWMKSIRAWVEVNSLSTGYIESVDGDSLLRLANEWGTIFRMERGIGDFIVCGTPFLSIANWTALENERVQTLNSLFVVSRQRTVQQDASFGICQISDIALKALSPGINDTTTAVMCMDYLGAILVHVASRAIPSAWRHQDGKLRLIAKGVTFDSLVSEAFDRIRQNATGNVAVLTRQAEILELLYRVTDDPARQICLQHQMHLISIVAESSIAIHDRAPVNTVTNRLLEQPSIEKRPQ